MIETTLYKCEFCDTTYKDKDKAMECENNHKKPVIISNAKYISFKSDKTGYPICIDVEMEDGQVITYSI